MLERPIRILSIGLILTSAVVPVAHAQWAVVDVGAIAQLVQEVATLRRQLLTAEAQLAQAKVALDSTMGSRGMQALLSGTVRNYLPTSYSQLLSASQGMGAYPALSSDVRAAMSGNAVLSPSQLSALPAVEQQQLVADRQAVALRQAITQEALAHASDRFASLQTLIAAISTASDQKSILDLQARISAELGMLQNEQTKLHVLLDAGDALSAANAQKEREQTIAGQGTFDTRFRPVP
jgi:type IV secretion system protein VirB5